MIDFEALQTAIPETTFQAYCVYQACTNGIADRSDREHSAKGGTFAYTYRPCASKSSKKKRSERYIPDRQTFAEAWRKSFMLRIVNTHLADHPCAALELLARP